MHGGGGLLRLLGCIARLVVPAAVATAVLGVAARAETAWTDTYVARLQALALLETLNADLLASRSATTVLETWCGSHGMAAPAILKAELDGSVVKTPTPEQRERLGVGPGETVKYRNVRLTCGSHVLSVADNWYVPARLTPEMNRALETTDTSFGRVVAPLKPTRRTLAASILWHPLPQGWEMMAVPLDHPDHALQMPSLLFEHRAVLYADDRLPFSEVVEHYTSEILNFVHP